MGCEGTDSFPSVVEAQKPGGRADQRWQRWIGGETHGGCLRTEVGGRSDLQDRVFLFAGSVVVDVFCEMVHCGVVVVRRGVEVLRGRY